MGSKGGGSVDTSGLEKATNRAIDLQEQVYGQTREDVQPWYQLGTGSVGRLSDLLGVAGGSMQSRDQMYDQLLPQYTTTSDATVGDGTLKLIDPEGRILSQDSFMDTLVGGTGRDTAAMAFRAYDAGDMDALDRYGYELFQAPSRQETIIDYNALNADLDERMADQQIPDDYGSLLQRFDLTAFEEDPGYQFRKDESQKALERGMAAQGVTLGGGGVGEINPQVARALQEQSQGLASQEYGNAYNRYVQDQLNSYNMLMGAAGMGQGSTGILATGGQNYATNVGNLTTGLAQAQLNADIAQASQPSMFDTMLGVGAQLGSAAIMASDVRLKENIEPMGMENGHAVYKFNYKGDDKTYVGVMAQEVLAKDPGAVVDMNGYYGVDYNRIGVKMRVA